MIRELLEVGDKITPDWEEGKLGVALNWKLYSILLYSKLPIQLEGA